MSKFSKMKKADKPVSQSKNIETKAMQVRLYKTDAIAFSHQAALNDQSHQDAMIEAVNLYLKKHGQAPAGNPGARPLS